MVEPAAHGRAFGYTEDRISTKAFLSGHLVLNSLVAFTWGGWGEDAFLRQRLICRPDLGPEPGGKGKA